MEYPQILRKINNILGFISGSIIAIVAIFSTYEGIVRTVYKPTVWTYDISRYLLICVIFLGSPYAFQVKGHVFVEFIREKLGEVCGIGFRKILSILGYLFVLLFIGVLTKNGITMLREALEYGDLTLANVQIPLFYLLIPIIFGSVMMFINICFIILDIINGGEEFI